MQDLYSEVRAGAGWRRVAMARIAGSKEYAEILHWLSVADNLVMMKGRVRDSDDEVLLDLDGQVFVVDTKGQYWVRVAVRRVSSAPDRPHGLSYSLTLHGPDGSRLVGFDNAHAVRESQGPGGKSRGHRDHKHRWRLFGLIGSKTRPHCLRTFGPRWMGS